MKFLEITKKLLKIKQKTNTKYTTNPFKENINMHIPILCHPEFISGSHKFSNNTVG